MHILVHIKQTKILYSCAGCIVTSITLIRQIDSCKSNYSRLPIQDFAVDNGMSLLDGLFGSLYPHTHKRSVYRSFCQKKKKRNKSCKPASGSPLQTKALLQTLLLLQAALSYISGSCFLSFGICISTVINVGVSFPCKYIGTIPW